MEKPTTVDAYIQQYPPNVRTMLEELRHIIAKAAPEATERISYGMPTFYQDGNLVHFAAWKSHIGLYPVPSAIQKFAKELTLFQQTKGSVHLPFNQPLPVKLIEKIVKFRIEENEQKKAGRLKAAKRRSAS